MPILAGVYPRIKSRAGSRAGNRPDPGAGTTDRGRWTTALVLLEKAAAGLGHVRPDFGHPLPIFAGLPPCLAFHDFGRIDLVYRQVFLHLGIFALFEPV